MAHTTPAERLMEGTVIKVSGLLSFSRLTSVYEGEELTRRISDERLRGSRYPVDVPHTTAALIDPVVEPAGPTMNAEEVFVEESIFSLARGDNAGHKSFRADNRGRTLPTIMELQDDGSYVQVQPSGELARGLKVTLVLKVYKPKNYEKRGIGIEAVLVNEKVRVFGRGSVADTLASLGVTVTGDLQHPVSVAAPPMSFEEVQAAAEQLPLPMPGVFDAEAVAPEAPAEPAPAAPVAPTPVESADDHIARLTAELAAAKAAAQPQAIASPWDIPAEV